MERNCSVGSRDIASLHDAWNDQVGLGESASQPALSFERFADHARVTDGNQGIRAIFARQRGTWDLRAAWRLGEPPENLEEKAPNWRDAYMQQHHLCYTRAERQSMALTARRQMGVMPRVWRVGDGTWGVAKDPRWAVCAVLQRNEMGEWSIDRYVRGRDVAGTEIERAQTAQYALQDTLNAVDVGVHIDRHCH
jgi:hypothetical protein